MQRPAPIGITVYNWDTYTLWRSIDLFFRVIAQLVFYFKTQTGSDAFLTVFPWNKSSKNVVKQHNIFISANRQMWKALRKLTLISFLACLIELGIIIRILITKCVLRTLPIWHKSQGYKITVMKKNNFNNHDLFIWNKILYSLEQFCIFRMTSSVLFLRIYYCSPEDMSRRYG